MKPTKADYESLGAEIWKLTKHYEDFELHPFLPSDEEAQRGNKILDNFMITRDAEWESIITVAAYIHYDTKLFNIPLWKNIVGALKKQDKVLMWWACVEFIEWYNTATESVPTPVTDISE